MSQDLLAEGADTMRDRRASPNPAGGGLRNGASVVRWLACLCGVIAVLVLVLLVIGPALERARVNVESAGLRARLHCLSYALLLYQLEKKTYPPDLQTLAAWKDCLGEMGLADFDVGEQKVQYVIPQSDDPDEAMLYHWPPRDDGAWVLYQNQELEHVTPAPDGTLTNPRTGTVIRPAGGTDRTVDR